MSLEDDIDKMTTKLKGVKRRFRIEAGRYGGEVAIGVVDEDFVDYWLDKVADEGDGDLVSTIVDLEWEETEPSESPDPKDDFSAWYDCDDVEHVNGPYADGQWIFTEVPADGSDDYAYNDTETEFQPVHMYGREAYHDENRIDSDPDDYVPVMAFHSSEKGSFGCWFVDVEGEDFEPEKVAFSSVETNVAEIVENVWYKKERLEPDYDNCDSTGKGYYASVGYMNVKWHDLYDTYTDEYLENEGYWDCFDDE